MHSSVTDEGGFNEPSPEIKALKEPVYDFENDIMPPVPPIPSTHPDVIGGVTYVDLAHRAQPEGIESDEVYDENESYRRMENGSSAVEATKEKIVYATIKPELPVKEMLYEKENILDIEAEDVKIDQDEPDRGYISPQRILDPTRARLHDDDEIDYVLNKKLPPEPPGTESETEEEEDEVIVMPAKKIPPPVPELNSPLDLQDVEFADASDDEDIVVNSRRISNVSEQVIPENMTSDEADRLLSSRYDCAMISSFIIFVDSRTNSLSSFVLCSQIMLIIIKINITKIMLFATIKYTQHDALAISSLSFDYA